MKKLSRKKNHAEHSITAYACYCGAMCTGACSYCSCAGGTQAMQASSQNSVKTSSQNIGGVNSAHG